MRLIKRIIQSEITDTSEKYDMSCQASINSDGRITLRNYSQSERDKDEIFVLSIPETCAIFELMHIIRKENIHLNYDCLEI